MITAITAILACQLLGELIARGSHLPIPGPVLGMAFLLLALSFSATARRVVTPVAQSILGNMMLLFVPAGVGAALEFGHLGARTLPLIIAVVVSTVLAISAGALSFVLVARAMGDGAKTEAADK